MNKIAIKLYACVLLLLCAEAAWAGNKDKYKEADELFQLKRYQLALDKYLSIEATGDTAVYLRDKIGDCYFYTFQYTNAEKYYALTYEKDTAAAAANANKYVRALVANSKYTEAENVLVKNETKLDETGKAYLRSVRWASQQKPQTMDKYDIRMTGIETGGLCLGFTLWDKSMIYSAKNTQGIGGKLDANYDLYIAEAEDLYSFADPKNLSAVLDAPFYEGSPTISADGNKLLYTANVSKHADYDYRKPGKFSINSKGENVLHMYISTRNDSNGWSAPVAVAFCDPEYNYIHPFLSNDGTTLYFSSNMDGGSGGYDLYYSKYNELESNWNLPVNMGNAVNTSMDELFPSTDAGGNYLFFSSNGHPGYGGLDVFRSAIVNGSWSEPLNFSSSINTPRDEFNLIMDSTGTQGYFASNRMMEGGDNIYAFRLVDYASNYTFTTLDGENKKALDSVLITVENKITGLEEAYVSDAEGKFNITLYNSYPYEITFRKNGYLTKRMELTANRNDAREVKEDVYLDKTPLIVKENRITLNNIYFDYNKFTLRPESNPVLDEVVKYLNSEPELQVELEAHTDSRGSDKYNLNLSQGRAGACVEYLIAKGIDPKRLIPIGYGEYRLVNKCKDGVKCTEDQHQQNRRVELKLIKKKKGDTSFYYITE